jgi:hypothetical protein
MGTAKKQGVYLVKDLEKLVALGKDLEKACIENEKAIKEAQEACRRAIEVLELKPDGYYLG